MIDNHSNEQRISEADPGTFKDHNIPTLAAIGFLSYCFTVMWHELIGHGLTMYIFGARSFVLTSTYIYSTDKNLSLTLLEDAFIFMNGSFSNLLLGLIVFLIFRVANRNNWSISWRVMLWHFSFNNIFFCFSYIFFSGVFGVGDWIAAINGLPNQHLIRIAESIIGIVTCLITARVAGKYLNSIPGNRWRITLVPYFSATLIFTAVGLRVPDTYWMIISVIPAAMLGQAVLPLAPLMAKKFRSTSYDREAIGIKWPLIALAVIIVLVLTYIAPGYKFEVG